MAKLNLKPEQETYLADLFSQKFFEHKAEKDVYYMNKAMIAEAGKAAIREFDSTGGVRPVKEQTSKPVKK